jgi:N6-adenosine-specific RNA methylase IME4
MNSGLRAHLLLADPPWPFTDKLPGNGRGADKHYRTLSIPEIMRFPLPPLENDCLLVLWRVASMQPEAFDVVRAWGFTVKSEIVWIKAEDREDATPQMGMGRYVRNEHEIALVCARGSFKVADHGVRSTFRAPRGIHSAKPDTIFEMAERLAGPDRNLVELFARKTRPGWHTMGDEIPTGYAWTPRVAVSAPSLMTPAMEAFTASAVGPQDGWARAMARSAQEEQEVTVIHAQGESLIEEVVIVPPQHAGVIAVKRGPGRPRTKPVDGAPKRGPGRPRTKPRPEDPNPPPATTPTPPTSGTDGKMKWSLSDETARAAFLQRAVQEGRMRANETIPPLSGWLLLQALVPPSWFEQGPFPPADENLSDLASRLDELGVTYPLPELASLSTFQRSMLRLWVEGGGKEGEVPDVPGLVRKPVDRWARAERRAEAWEQAGRPAEP